MSDVYFTSLRTHAGYSLPDKLEHLMREAGIEKIDFRDRFTAVKLHFGEPGNMAYIRAGYVRRIAEVLNGLGAKTFLSDSNTLYKGFRGNAVDHLQAAQTNGFNAIEIPAPVIIADGVKGTDFAEMDVPGGEMCSKAKIGRAFADADIIVSVSHFKGHEQAGFGGTLKNIGMGCASVAGKHFLHCDSKPEVDKETCIGCRMCEKYCEHGAIRIRDRKAEIDYSLCAGCGQCIATCTRRAVRAQNDTSMYDLNKKIAEYTLAVVNGKPQFHISFIMNVSPECDCWGHNDAAVVPDLGIAASFDPVALDEACADLVMAAPTLPTENVLHEMECGHHTHTNDKFRIMHPDTRWEAAQEHGEKIGLGSRKYRLIKV